MAVTVGFEPILTNLSSLSSAAFALSLRGFRHFVDVQGDVRFVNVLLTLYPRSRRAVLRFSSDAA